MALIIRDKERPRNPLDEIRIKKLKEEKQKKKSISIEPQEKMRFNVRRREED